MWTTRFWKRAAERFVRGFATAFVLTTSALEAMVAGSQFGWRERALAGLAQGAGAVALSLVGSQVGDPESPAFVENERPRGRHERSGSTEAEEAPEE